MSATVLTHPRFNQAPVRLLTHDDCELLAAARLLELASRRPEMRREIIGRVVEGLVAMDLPQ